MELRQLEYLLTVVEEAGFTRAAEKLHVAQPGISAQLRRLERELGQELLDRSGRTVRPTAAGAAVLPYARAALAAVAGARLAVDELAGLVRGRVAVGTVTSHDIGLPELLAGFHAEHPAVEITLTEDDSTQLADAVREGRLDLALLSLGPAGAEGLVTHVVADEPFLAAVALGHELAGRETMPLRGLRDRALISLSRGTGLRAHLESACAAAGFAPYVAFEASSPPVLAQLAARGLGVAVLPGPIARSRDDLHSLPIVRPELRGRLAFVWRAEGSISPAARALAGQVRRTFTQPGRA